MTWRVKVFPDGWCVQLPPIPNQKKKGKKKCFKKILFFIFADILNTCSVYIKIIQHDISYVKRWFFFSHIGEREKKTPKHKYKHFKTENKIQKYKTFTDISHISVRYKSWELGPKWVASDVHSHLTKTELQNIQKKKKLNSKK